jgi:hypothetical protein
MNNKVMIALIAGVLFLGVCGFCLFSGGLLALLGSSEVEQADTGSLDVALAGAEVSPETEEQAAPEAIQDQSAHDRAVETAETFMAALSVGEFTQDYNLSSAELQAELGSPEAFQQVIDANSLRPESWEWENKTLDMENKLMIMAGNVIFTDGRAGIVNLELELKSSDWEGDWKVYYLNLEPTP